MLYGEKNYYTQNAPVAKALALIGHPRSRAYVALLYLRRLSRGLPRLKMVSVRMRPCVLSLLLLNGFYCFVSSLYFHIGETEKKCFIEEIPDETMIIGECRRRKEVSGQC